MTQLEVHRASLEDTYLALVHEADHREAGAKDAA